MDLSASVLVDRTPEAVTLACVFAGDKPHKCEFCDKCFSRKDNLTMHMRCHTSVKPHKCHLCDYAAVDSSSLKKHLRIHSDERPYPCPECGKCYKTKVGPGPLPVAACSLSLLCPRFTAPSPWSGPEPRPGRP